MKKYMNLENFKKDCINALKEEIAYKKSEKITVYNIKLNAIIDYCFYTLQTQEKSCLSVNTPCVIFVDEERIPVSVAEINDSFITIVSEKCLGEYIETATIEKDDTYLNLELIKRLEEMSDEKLSEIAKKIIFRDREVLISNDPIKLFPDNVEKIKSVLIQDIIFLLGPPGTGKTFSISKIVNKYIANGYRVLLLANSNKAVDKATMEICKSGYTPGDKVRFGYSQEEKLKNRGNILSNQLARSRFPDLVKNERHLIEKIAEDDTPLEILEFLRKKLSEVQKEIKKKEYEIIRSATFVATTFCMAYLNPNIYEQEFDVVIVDEASMAYIPQIAFAANLASKHFVCVGDPEQLPPVSVGKNNKILKLDIFEYEGIAQAVSNKKGHEWLYMLCTQYRMHPTIAAFLSKYVYCDLLKTARNINRELYKTTNLAPLKGQPIVIADTGIFSPQKTSADKHGVNLLNAFVSVAIAFKNINKCTIGIITPYKAQANLINNLIAAASPENKSKINVVCSTVHKFQGSQEDMIIFDSVDSSSFEKPGMLLHDTKSETPRKLFNVAMSRAKGKFIFVGDVEFLRKKLPDNSLIHNFLNEFSNTEMQMSKNQIVDLLKFSSKNNFNVFSSENFFELICNNIEKAKTDITLNLPNNIPSCSENILNVADEKDFMGIRVLMSVPQEHNIPSYFDVIHSEIKNEFAIIDGETVLYNALPKENISVSIKNKDFAAMIKNALR